MFPPVAFGIEGEANGIESWLPSPCVLTGKDGRPFFVGMEDLHLTFPSFAGAG